VPSFVLLWHELSDGSGRPSHYDLMLEGDGVLSTWAIDSLPTPGTTLAAMQLADHRLAYLQYEGEIRGGRGTVVRKDAGTYRTLKKSTERWQLAIEGSLLQGHLTLERQADQRWTVSLSAEADFSAGNSS
jgi:hypothetical protein